MSGVKHRTGGDHVEVTCGCTSHRYGDAVGRVRVFHNGDLFVSCDCTPGCREDKLTPAAFEKHSGSVTARKWKNNVSVMVNGEKVPLGKTVLLKYYEMAVKSGNGSIKFTARVCRRDKFVRRSRCNKVHQFRIRSKEECHHYHKAVTNAKWKCADFPLDNITCEDDKEQAIHRVYRGCTRSPTCEGCTLCVCFGCEICRSSNCSCQMCTDFIGDKKA